MTVTNIYIWQPFLFFHISDHLDCPSILKIYSCIRVKEINIYSIPCSKQRHFARNYLFNPLNEIYHNVIILPRERNPDNKYLHQQQHKSSQKKFKNCRYKKPNIPITNLSNHQLSRDDIILLSKGLNFIPTPKRDHPAKMLQDILLFDRKIRLKYHFCNDSDKNHGT